MSDKKKLLKVYEHTHTKAKIDAAKAKLTIQDYMKKIVEKGI